MEEKETVKEELRDKFFKECTDKDERGFLYINYSPHDLFEWFQKNMKLKNQLSESDNPVAPLEVVERKTGEIKHRSNMNHAEIIIDILDGMQGIGGVPFNEEFYNEFDFRLRNALNIKASQPPTKKLTDECNALNFASWIMDEGWVRKVICSDNSWFNLSDRGEINYLNIQQVYELFLLSPNESQSKGGG